MEGAGSDDTGRVFLATTALEEFWDRSKEMVFLGPWCRLYSRASFNEELGGDVIKSPWDDRDKLFEACKYVNSLYERVLPALATQLNSMHGVEQGERYWRILLGPWLIYYIPAVYDRYVTLLGAFERYPGLTTTVLSEESYVTPADTLEFVQLLKDDPYNLQIYSRILKLSGRAFPQRKEDIKSVRFIIREKGVRAGIKRLASGGLLALGKATASRRLVILKNSYFSNEIEAAITLKTFGKAWPIKGDLFELPELHIDNNAREAMRNALSKGRDGFELMLASMIPSDMPKAFIEGFDLIKNAAEKTHPPKPMAIFSSGAWYYDEPFKQWAAGSTESGTALLGMQHGGNYGSLAFHPSEDHEIAITDRYYTWGWDRIVPAGKTFPRPATKLSGRRPFGADNSKEGILFAATALHRYLFQFPSHPGRFVDYLSWQARFASALPQGLKSKTRGRLHKADNGWSIAERWKAICPEAMIESWERPFMASLEACRLYVCDHLSTTFIEALSANKPTILFWDPDANELRPEARPYYDRLFEAGILHYSPEAAAGTIVAAYDDVEKWWNSPIRQEARRAFCNRFALTSKDAVKEWADEFNRMTKNNLSASRPTVHDR
ncbi:MAG: LIC12162 family protein [Deltaproteobacteria bacterium]